MPADTRRILVTGGAGFIALHLVIRLREGLRVGVLGNLSTGTQANLDAYRRAGLRPCNVLAHDLTDASVIAVIAGWTPDVVIHLAAQARVTTSAANIAHDAVTNIIGTVHVLQAVRAANAQRVILASSGGTVYGGLATDREVFTETDPPGPPPLPGWPSRQASRMPVQAAQPDAIDARRSGARDEIETGRGAARWTRRTG